MSGGPISVGTRSTISKSDEFYKNQALRAALASQKAPIAPPKRLTKEGFVSSGALAAAARAGTGIVGQSSNNNNSYVNQTQRAGGVQTIGGNGNKDVRTTVSPEQPRGPSRLPQTSALTLASPSATSLFTPVDQPAPRQPSPSHIAAVRAAAARSTTPGTGARGPEKSPKHRDESRDHKDESPIPATDTLVRMFEARTKPDLTVDVRPITSAGPPVVLSPKPVRAASVKLAQRSALLRKVEEDEAKRQQISPSSRDLTVPERAATITRPKSVDFKQARRKEMDVDAAANPLASKRLSSSRTTSLDKAAAISASALPQRPMSMSMSISTSRVSSISPSRHGGSSRPAMSSSSSSSTPRPTSYSHSITSSMLVPDEGTRAASVARRGAHQSEHVRPQLNVDSLANAMVASSLASSRAASPYKSPPPQAPEPPPPRRSHGRSLGVASLFHHTGHSNAHPRQTSPGKTNTLRSTLRSTPQDPEGPTVHVSKGHGGSGGGGAGGAVAGGVNKLRKHGKAPDLDSIAAADRKLYEGVWAANRGILVPEYELAPSSDAAAATATGTAVSPQQQQQSDESKGTAARPRAAADEVHGYVVRDIWSRSGLDAGVLEHVWALVDGGENGVKRSARGRLDRQEFVVGMWLVDQALAGRKLPPRRLPDHVWASLRIANGGFEFRR